MAVVGNPRNYFKKFAFILECDGIAWAGFQKFGPLEAEVAVIEQWEGGALAADKSPGRYKTTDAVGERGACLDLDLWLWFKQVANIAANTGLVDPQYKRNMDVVQLDRDGSELRRWPIYECFPSKFKAGDWDNTADANVAESITFTYKYFAPLDDPPSST